MLDYRIKTKRVRQLVILVKCSLKCLRTYLHLRNRLIQKPIEILVQLNSLLLAQISKSIEVAISIPENVAAFLRVKWVVSAQAIGKGVRA